MDLADLEQPGCRVEVHSEPHTLLDNFFYVSGFVPRNTAYETGLPTHASRMAEGGEWKMDPDIAEERYLAVKVRGACG